MKTPRFFLFTAVLFWGWQVHLLWIAICLGVLLESANIVKSKFDFKPSDFNKFIDISTVLLAGTIVIALTIEAKEAIFILLKWLPLIFLPVMAAQVFSTKNKIDVQSFFIVTRKKIKRENYYTDYNYGTIDFSYIYSLFCIISAGSANRQGNLYFLCVVILFSWALWHVRSKRISLFLWGICILATIISGFAGHRGISIASMKINQLVMEYFDNYYNINPFKNSTAMGDITNLKLSDKIVLRVSFENYTPGRTYLLHNAGYNKFVYSNWFVKSDFKAVEPGSENTFWQINPFAENTKKMTVYCRLVKKKSVLSLPSGVVSIDEMKTGSCEKNSMQSVRIEDGPSLIKSVVSYTDTLLYDAKPYDHDLLIPKNELPGISHVARELGFADKSDGEILEIIKNYFLTNYTYSLNLKGKGEYKTPLLNFLMHTKAGHCEFFATAAALLLRQAGIPARYATGFIAHEYSKMENRLIVRQRDAHAWVKVFLDGQWENFDTTPPSFLINDSQITESSLIKDFFSFLGFKLSLLKNETGAKMMKKYGFWLTLPLGVILFFRLRGSNKIKRVRTESKTRENRNPKNREPSFLLIEKMLHKKGFPKYEYETYSAWIDRIGYSFDSTKIKDILQSLLRLHNKKRFSKSGLNKYEQKKFHSGIKNIL
ncbi:MAG: transglutaminase-like domain-containing protein [Thermodesulfobacteriota bacterium]